MNQNRGNMPENADETMPFDNELRELLVADRELPHVTSSLRESMRKRVQLQLALRAPSSEPSLGSPTTPVLGPSTLVTASSYLATAVVGAVVGSVLTWALLQSSFDTASERVRAREQDRTESAVAAVVASQRAQVLAPNPVVAANDVPEAVVANGSEQETSPSRRAQSGDPATSPSAPTSTLRQEQLLIESARDALARGQTGDGLALIEQHRARFLHGALAEDREFILIRTLQAQGHSESAIAHAEDFLRNYPESSYVRRLSEVIPAWRRAVVE